MKEPQDHIAPPPDCTGCGLCANVCPKDAIRMVWSGEGFSVPAVDEEACIRCGLCVRKCIAGGGKYAEYDDDLARVRAFGAWTAYVSLHLEPSSGGGFSAMAD
ncbi:MAG: 4Fe-4S binding protein [Akkermansiaceae bacterium]|nr:4Fe-4S binding protein [Akkermansiaceae bacterium]